MSQLDDLVDEIRATNIYLAAILKQMTYILILMAIGFVFIELAVAVK